MIDYTKADYTSDINKYDIVFDAVGKSSFGKAKKTLKETGIYLTTVPTPGVMAQTVTKKKSPNKRAGFIAAGLRKPHIKLEDMTYLEQLLLSGELKPLHGKVYELEDLGEAQVYVETGHKVGNVVIEVLK